MSRYPRLFRPARPGDVPLVLDSWQRSYSRSPWAGTVPNNRWLDVMRDLCTGLLARGARVTVACAPDDHDQVLGWVCHESTPDKVVVHYVFVKEPWRRDGIATELWLEAARPDLHSSVFYTHRQRSGSPGDRFVEAVRRLQHVTHAPEIARRRDL